MPRSSQYRMTPSAAARPNADPPLSTTASRRSTSARGLEEGGLAGRGCAAAHLAGGDGAVGEQHDRAPGERDLVGPVTDPDARDREHRHGAV